MSAKDPEFHPAETLDNLEDRYFEFYSSIVQDYYDADQDVISRAKDALDSGKAPADVFKFLSARQARQCAYLLQSAAHDTCLGVDKLCRSARGCKKIFNKLLSKDRINICCLGSRALYAALGVCKVIHESVDRLQFDPTRVQIFIVDKSAGWRKLSEHVVSASRKEFPNLKLKLDFLTEDVTKNFSDEAILRITKSHVVAMVKCISNLPSEETVASITENILTNMKKNAVLFYLDEDTKDRLKTVKNVIAKRKSFSELSSHMPEQDKMHKQSDESLHTSNLNSNSNTAPLAFSAWIKNPDIKTEFVKEKPVIAVKQTEVTREKKPAGRYKAKSSNTLRNSKETFKLVGKFAYKDMEKKNKDDSKRQRAKDAGASRYADFDSWSNDY